MGTLNFVLKGDDRQSQGKPLTMQIWTNAADTLLFMIVAELPSSKVAQRHHVGKLYEGPMDDEAAKAIKACGSGFHG